MYPATATSARAAAYGGPEPHTGGRQEKTSESLLRSEQEAKRAAYEQDVVRDTPIAYHHFTAIVKGLRCMANELSVVQDQGTSFYEVQHKLHGALTEPAQKESEAPSYHQAMEAFWQNADHAEGMIEKRAPLAHLLEITIGLGEMLTAATVAIHREGSRTLRNIREVIG